MDVLQEERVVALSIDDLVHISYNLDELIEVFDWIFLAF